MILPATIASTLFNALDEYEDDLREIHKEESKWCEERTRPTLDAEYLDAIERCLAARQFLIEACLERNEAERGAE